MNFGQKALQFVETFAPTVAKAFTGPLGGMAVQGLLNAFGLKPDQQDQLETAMLNATPDQVLAMKKLEQDFQVQMKQLGVTEEQLQYQDLASARAREEAVKDRVPAHLAYMITLGFFAVLGYLIGIGKPKEGGDALLVMLGALGTAWAGVVAYYFGSSAGARRSADVIAQIAKQ